MDILCGNIYRVTSLSKLDTYVTEMFMPNSKSIIPKLTIKAIRTDGPTLILKRRRFKKCYCVEKLCFVSLLPLKPGI